MQGVEAADVSAVLPDDILDAKKTPTVNDGNVAGPDAEVADPSADDGNDSGAHDSYLKSISAADWTS